MKVKGIGFTSPFYFHKSIILWEGEKIDFRAYVEQKRKEAHMASLIHDVSPMAISSLIPVLVFCVNFVCKMMKRIGIAEYRMI